ncbi:DUF4097 family beta strand repeat-containing protein [Cyclobacterium jeungdonense]|uniref:DUF4097 family beta strand repeat-containing protein n=1 Tax=Cyclobacterium jeungdonense TaxID=708087 RepID=A0ABT8C478_9BACT|nr:DUF4097 family beta strand repeat-containing protein [Cyclobacterium jeungdonense]MDN3686583.1 DUF4097 family beta strand repeat-containing protein [Cyclobacterium jeungdonense]
MKSLSKIYLLSFILAAFGSQYGQSQELIQKTFPGIQQLEISAGAIAIEYEGDEGMDQIQLEALLGANENTDKTLVMITVGNTLKIAYDPPRGSWSNKKYIRMKGPSAVQLDINNGSGSLTVSGVRAPVTHLQVGSGQIHGKDITGKVSVKGSSGSIRMEKIDGNVDCQLTSGNAILEQINGNVDFKATSGQFKAYSVKGVLNARLTSGNMRLDQIGELGKLEITSGNIKADRAGLGSNSYFNGSSGNIQIHTGSNLQSYNYELQAGSGNIRVANHSQSKSLSIHNGNFPTIKGKISSGNISILPL